MQGRVVAVSVNPGHTFSKRNVPRITLLAGRGVEGDAHCGATVKHRSRLHRDQAQANLRQVHLIHNELYDELVAKGFAVAPGNLGENITTAGLDLLALPAGAELALGDSAVVRITGLRNPCAQLDGFQSGLTAAVLERLPDGKLLRKSGVMSVVVAAGVVEAGDVITVTLPPEPHRALECV